MVLGELGSRISGAIQRLNTATVIDDKALTICVNEITHALLQADVQFKLVQALSSNVRKSVEKLAAGHDKRHIIQKAVFHELHAMLDAGKPSFTPTKGRTNAVMLVGLQGCGKTTTCTKYALHYRKKGFNPALVCADTFRAGAFDQLKQNATKVKIPFYGSYTETDPVVIAQEGVRKFADTKHDLIILDTSGRHKQENALFEEMRQLAAATNPDLIIFVMDSSIGQAANDQALAFRESAKVGAVIITKIDGHAKGGGALSAVAATKSPIIFLGTGEKADDFETFESKAFVSRLLGMGDLAGFANKIKEVVPSELQPELVQKLADGNISFKFLCDQIENITSMGSLSQLMSMIPGFNNVNVQSFDIQQFRKYRVILDSMTNEERNSSSLSESRILRLAKGSGTSVDNVQQMMNHVKTMSKQMKGLKLNKKGDLGKGKSMQDLSKMLPANIVKQFGGMGGLQTLMKQLPR
ncbi:hypothetical protein SELMODRAFT_129975 [Selaginella moellendorffii]|uniref:Signal recognition particle 54 kDa protein n=1 Tax=Selaginella moellendorffii TaxID=88036 RepID=D8T1M7_SELML|nr:signal recognition particle 54 kDa protein 2 [Selaginella moellendorffii]EFJ09417.1 hypothetical protein SELMODRAFT_129975 [Selaginella moellendorffii]|eukprot:XP_002989541.1 signal recognition particle 54 kDa protein 2 [Selaginella moellendorffii]